MPQGGPSRLLIAVENLVKEPVVLGLAGPQGGGGHGRHQSDGHEQAGQQGVSNGQGHVSKQLAGDPLYKYNGQKHAHSGQGGGNNGPRDLHRPLNRGLGSRTPLIAQAVDVLNHHHRVVHQHTHPHSQAGQGNHVQGDPGEVHEHNGHQQGDGDGKGNHNRGPDVLQKQQENQHCQGRAQNQVLQHSVHHNIDVIPLVGQGGEAQALIFAGELLKPLQYVLGHLGCGVGGLFGKGEHQAVFPVDFGVELMAVVLQSHIRHVF